MKVLELFSGMGGMHYALMDAGVTFEVVAALDISEVPNRVYRHNFPDVPHSAKNICGLTVRQWQQWAVEAVLMSPPCQPFTRQGHQKDTQDPRSQPLLHLLTLLPKVPTLKYILVENVKGFEESEARSKLIDTLKSMNFHWQEFLISPMDLGVPNSRLRYYLIGQSSELAFQFPTRSEIWTDTSSLRKFSTSLQTPAKLKSFLETNPPITSKLSDAMLLRYAEVMDIVTEESERSCCFTKSYGRYVEGTGSILQQSGDLDSVYRRFRALPKEDEAQRVAVLRELDLRFFTPREICRLMGFPEDFEFPPESTPIHRFRVLGNSLNVKVVSFLLQLLIPR
ncbi:hypothetical protein TCAL_10044 [Tigriopus californicus]|uniref:tRNA (cytosine(38)-C(5))-methyltransferase n=1 Tax=Tigriopus californicus TaxID=6832 RepID=A0A553PQD4_TIGCA|nr:tRNA (cytosine(38)-C(5))-methyltransferase-like [Tigriopus californicus]TRY79898.1 hypothetical protein TCAL_10044 [Tigriopus californicus]|eukprot:TCALIF_10044-PA protein Name:"Similar to Trdmt1 tRNA (cytosine(38)-C(5))-methyltransferase (Rattus norvegicus)" AED:0.04 eAED:0.04 QI:125/0.5/0.33/1/1/0.66/3/0/337